MCLVLEIEIEPSGFYVWLRQPERKRAIEGKRLLGQVKQFWIESGFAYGYRNITTDMKDAGETCGHNRVHRIMKAAGIRSQRGYKRHPGFKGRKQAMLRRTSSSGNLRLMIQTRSG
jgi:putative transposase